MPWLKKFPWISLSLLIATYGVSGWHYADWSHEMIIEGQLLSWTMEPAIAATIVYGLAAIGIIAIANVLNMPIDFLTVGLGGWLKSEAQAVMSIFFGALAFTLIVQRLHHFVRFLILLAAFLLFKLDFQAVGYSRRLSQIIVILFSLSGFASGVVLFYSFN